VEVSISGSTIQAQNCATGAVLYTGSDAATIINDAISLGGKVYIGPGTYTLTAMHIGGLGAIGSSSVNNVELYGAGESSTILQAATNMNGGMIEIMNVNGWYIHDLTINGNAASQSLAGASSPYQNGIGTWQSNNDVVQNVYVENEKTYGISFQGSGQVLNNQVVNSWANGIIMYGGSNDLVQGNVVNGASDVGISISGTDDNGNAPITNVLCTGNTVSNVNLNISPYGQNSGVGIMVGDNGYDENVTVSNNKISNVKFGVSVDPYTGTNTDVYVTGNTITSATINDVYAEHTSTLVISNNVFVNPPTVPIQASDAVTGLTETGNT
jgi:hypothetical protein